MMAEALEQALPADILIVGFQEAIELSSWNVVYGADEAKVLAAAKQWVADSLEGYVCFAEANLIGLVTLCFCKVEMLGTASLQEIAVTTVKTGDVGQAIGLNLMKMGNKGGVLVRWRIHDTTYLVANCHLAAHQDNVRERV